MTLLFKHIPSRQGTPNNIEEYYLEATRFVNLPKTVQLTSRYAKGFPGRYAVVKFTHTERTRTEVIDREGVDEKYAACDTTPNFVYFGQSRDVS